MGSFDPFHYRVWDPNTLQRDRYQGIQNLREHLVRNLCPRRRMLMPRKLPEAQMRRMSKLQPESYCTVV